MKPLSTPIFENKIARIGLFRCPTEHPDFGDTGPIRNGHLMVFPRTSVRILLPDREPIVATPHTVMFYNNEQRYRREPLSYDGDRCEWFAFAPALLAAAFAAREPNNHIKSTHPFPFAHAQSDAHCYLQQRLIVAHLLQARTQGEAPDHLWLEEALHNLLAHVLDQIYGTTPTKHNRRPRKFSPQTEREHRTIARRVQEQIGAHFTRAITLDELAATVHLSAYELCRIFRAQTATTIHQYTMQLRLRAALERITDPGIDLTTVALDLGYSSHSHFTSAFRRAFGILPSALRRNQRVGA
ncbi:MAG: helix-turn-helix transcriptional regulator [Caldilineaceae bacterium]|nr:helix-turn-helix transcriptional regulator [Caldilineaceae bacterium]